MNPEQRLYCTPGAEECYFDPAGSYESQIEPWLEPGDRERREIEEWSVLDPSEHVPPIDTLLDWLTEWIADNGMIDENGYDQWLEAARTPEVCQAADALLTAIASTIKYRMADKHLRSLWVTWDEAGEPLLDGEPMYVKAASK